MTGTIKTTNRERGFGFITADDGRDFFYHRSALDGVQFADLAEGDQVEFEAEAEAPRGPRARTVRPIAASAA